MRVVTCLVKGIRVHNAMDRKVLNASPVAHNRWVLNGGPAHAHLHTNDAHSANCRQIDRDAALYG